MIKKEEKAKENVEETRKWKEKKEAWQKLLCNFEGSRREGTEGKGRKKRKEKTPAR